MRFVKGKISERIEQRPPGRPILSSGAVGVDEAKLGNLKAMVQAAKEYGVYK
jgi:hypothetical protein